MPNWCQNYISFEAKFNNKVLSYLHDIQKNFEKGNFNDYLIPAVDNYEQNTENWGTKWDVDGHGFNITEDGNNIYVHCSFSTAWSPNIPVSKVFFESLIKITDVKNYEHNYSEGGCCFYGTFNGTEDKCYDMNIAYHIIEDDLECFILEKKANGILKFDALDNLFLIKEESDAVFNIYNKNYTLKKYSCFSETYGEDVSFYKYENNWYTTDIWI